LFMHLTNSEYVCLVIKSCLELKIRFSHFYKNVLWRQTESWGDF
jgi:hypothetical protein